MHMLCLYPYYGAKFQTITLKSVGGVKKTQIALWSVKGLLLDTWVDRHMDVWWRVELYALLHFVAGHNNHIKLLQ